MTPASPAPAAQARIAEIAARLDAATPGPWHAGKNVVGTRNEMGFVKHIVETCWGDALPPDGIPPRHDMDLIAHAPADIAHLLSEVARLSAEAAAVRAGALEEAAKVCDQRFECWDGAQAAANYGAAFSKGDARRDRQTSADKANAKMDAAEEIAAAIRALAAPSPTGDDHV